MVLRPLVGWRGGLLAVALLVAPRLPAEAARLVPPGQSPVTLPRELPHLHPLLLTDLTQLQFEDNTVIFPNGSRLELHIDEKGNYHLPGGHKFAAWGGLPIEKTLASDDFVCHHGRLVGIRMPEWRMRGKRKRKSLVSRIRLHHVVRRPMPNIEPMECYQDLVDPARHFLIFPPEEVLSEEWRLMTRLAKDWRWPLLGWSEERMFLLGGEHPCGPNRALDDSGQEEVWQNVHRIKEQVRDLGIQALAGAMASASVQDEAGRAEAAGEEARARASAGAAAEERRQEAPDDEGANEGRQAPRLGAVAQGQEAARAKAEARRQDPRKDDGLDDGKNNFLPGVAGPLYVAQAKPGPSAVAALRSLVSVWWKPRDWAGAVQGAEVPEAGDR